LDFVINKHDIRKLQDEKRKYFPVSAIESPEQKPSYSTKIVSTEEMNAVVEYEASQSDDNH
jgi:hypothetical protein